MTSSYEVAFGPRGAITRDSSFEYVFLVCFVYFFFLFKTMIDSIIRKMNWPYLCDSLIVQCRYVGTTIEALVIEVSLVPPPQPVVAPGPLRVELRLANGQCTGKGCTEG